MLITRTVLGGMLLLAMSACHPQEKSMKEAIAAQHSEHQQAHRRSEPGRPQILTMILEGAPGPFATVRATAQYDVSNDAACGELSGMTGNGKRITSNESFPLEKISDTEYRGIFYLDLMEDEDYYGRGICHWQFTEVRVGLKAHAAESTDTEFAPSLAGGKVLEKAKVTRYFWNGYYPQAKSESAYATFGDANLDEVAEGQKQEFFAISLAAQDGAL